MSGLHFQLSSSFPSGLVSPEERFPYGAGDLFLIFFRTFSTILSLKWRFTEANHLNSSFVHPGEVFRKLHRRQYHSSNSRMEQNSGFAGAAALSGLAPSGSAHPQRWTNDDYIIRN